MVLGLSAVVAGFAASPAGAACSTPQVPVGHSQDDFFICADNGPVGFFAYSLSTTAPDAGANSNGQKGVCIANDPTTSTGQGTPCTNPNAGTVNDNQVDVQYDWGALNVGAIGCPSNAGSTEGAELVAYQIVDTSGKSVLIQVGYDIGFAGYLVDQAFQLNADQTALVNAACTLDNAPVITSSSAGPSPSISNVCTHLNPTHVLSSCDPNSLGSFDFGAGAPCGAGAAPSTGLGKLYSKTGPCGSPPDLRVVQGGWTLLGVQGADACNPIPVPATGQCAFIGATGLVGGVETAAIAGALQVGGQAASVDKVKIDKATFSQGKLLVGFSTINETSIVGFNVYAGSTKLNSGLVQAKGTGSNTYSYEAARSDVKANKTVTVEAVKSDGSVEKSAPVSLK
jgi:hypothetical protein